MALITVRDLTIRYTDPPLLDQVSFLLHEGERVCLLGRNGTGKSTLMKLIANEFKPTDGEISRKPNIRIAYLPQEVPSDLHGNVFDIILSGHDSQHDSNQSQEEQEEWKQHQQVESVISQLKLDGDAEVSSLSAGWKRRVLLAKGLVRKPDVLLLDEPTNHLDIESIDWIERFLLRYQGTLLFVTHDRMFLRKLATRILEIDRGEIINWDCDYDTYLKRKEDNQEIEKKQNANFDKKLAEEEAWLRKGIKARRTRNEGRVRTLLKMREERKQRRSHLGNVQLQLQETIKSGDLVIEAENLAFSYSYNPIVNDLSVTIMRGDKVGVIGPNGSGKTTLLQLLLKNLEPENGTVRHGTKLEIAYFDQLRYQLDEEKSVFDNVSEGNDRIVFNGQTKHVIGYLQDFLFTPERSRALVKTLSGGERNRLLLAKLFTKPANLLVLDEPTNDLDAETLELLEDLLVNYSGTILLVSHDRAFLNNVVTSTLALEGNGEVNEYVGGYDDWIRQRKETQQEIKKTRVKEREQEKTNQDQPKRLSYNEKRKLQMEYQELQDLPKKIEQLETEQNEIHLTMADPAFFKKHVDEIVKTQDRLAEIEKDLQDTYQRWESLEEQFETIDLKMIQ
jgi:ATP-binding cassette subfamily F protein uup